MPNVTSDIGNDKWTQKQKIINKTQSQVCKVIQLAEYNYNIAFKLIKKY